MTGSDSQVFRHVTEIVQYKYKKIIRLMFVFSA